MSSLEGFDVFPANDSLGFGQFAMPEQLPDNQVQSAVRSDLPLIGDIGRGTLEMYGLPHDPPGLHRVFSQFKPERHETGPQQDPQRTIEGEQQ